jgi:hypothetical protein
MINFLHILYITGVLLVIFITAPITVLLYLLFKINFVKDIQFYAGQLERKIFKGDE